MHRSRGRTTAVLAALAAALVLAIVPASASALGLTATPATGLSSPATVQVSGSGWPASGSIRMRECTVDNIDCTAVIATASSDGAGNFAGVPVTVTRTFVGNATGGTIDCRVTICVIWGIVSPCACFTTAQTPISFAPPPQGTTPGNGDTGKRAAALKRCKQRAKKHDWSKQKLRKCKRRAKSLPA